MGELERIGQQVLDDLLHPLDVGEHRLRQRRVETDVETDPLGLRHVPEGALDVALQVEQAQLADVDHHRARLDLRQVENVVDQREQIVARGVNGLRRLDLLAAEVALLVLGQLVGEQEQAVERRAQLVRHVGKELGLVFRGEGELLGLLFKRLAGLLHFGVLALDLLVLVGELARLLLQLLVGLLQLLGEGLRLLEQIFRAGVRLDRVDHDADRFGELIEERLMRRVETVEGGELEHAAHLAFEHHREHQHVQRRGLGQARGDAECLGRHVGQQ